MTRWNWPRASPEDLAEAERARVAATAARGRELGLNRKLGMTAQGHLRARGNAGHSPSTTGVEIDLDQRRADRSELLD